MYFSFLIKRSCAEPKAKNILDDLSTLVEYYSVSNDSMDRRMMISEAVPGTYVCAYVLFYFFKLFFTCSAFFCVLYSSR